ncbi:hypothetical protein Aph01nite_02730 [Acrocarpospora phusangensis]|uniref:Uncharacterized protein n=1 Tax=Acrocarpospora phusangensis TaxID=1070424 RepID=A0A919UL45_9ACTN|nr:hypothetical protein Aph01nite_02730 [Acrocarpospora phusangensis]
MQRVQVLVGVDGDAAQAGVRARAGDPNGDLAAIGDQDLLHRISSPDFKPDMGKCKQALCGFRSGPLLFYRSLLIRLADGS